MDPRKIRAWKDGMTGLPLVDANMRELSATGFMSNRGRQNVCSFLAIDMNMDWRHGAAHFEEHLLDHDVHSNWGNWCSGAGMTGGRLNRFNIVKQSKDYDFGGDYVRLWCPELTNVPDRYVHEPWKMSESLMDECGVKIGPGRDYPSPIVDPNSTPKIMDDGRVGEGGRGRGGGGGKHGGKGGGDRGDDGGRNPNRGRGQRRDMKSLKTGSYSFDSKYV
jgi:deoxyribodipyrimidine photo-lyase